MVLVFNLGEKMQNYNRNTDYKKKLTDYSISKKHKKNNNINSQKRLNKAKAFSLSSYRALLLFVLLIVLSAQTLIMTTQIARSKQFKLQELEKQGRELEIERGRLLLERGALTSPVRIEKIGREKLNMHFPKSSEISLFKEPK